MNNMVNSLVMVFRIQRLLPHHPVSEEILEDKWLVKP
jgi:hypothetical protein